MAAPIDSQEAIIHHWRCRGRLMSTEDAAREAVFPIVLRDCLAVEDIDRDELVRRLTAQGTPGALVQAVDVLLSMHVLADAWPCDEVEFIRAASPCFPSVLQAEWRLTTAAALDTMRRADP